MAETDVTPSIVYALWSTRDRVIRYIGQTTCGLPELRLSQHRQAARRGRMTPVARWFAAEEAAGHLIRLKVLFWDGDAAVSEIEYIALYRALGAPLLNRTAGAAGVVEGRIAGPISAETRKRLSDAHRKRKTADSTRAKHRAYHAGQALGRAASAEYFRATWHRGPWF